MTNFSHGPVTFDGPAQSRIRAFAAGLTAQGNTAIYDALTAAYGLVGRPDPEWITTVVLLTDGENNRGSTFDEFIEYYRSLPDAPPVLPVLFGESNIAEMRKLAELTSGHTFDGRTESLSEVFARIRSSR